MKRHWPFAVLCIAFVVGVMTIDTRAQGRGGRGRGDQPPLPKVPAAEVHVAAAKAAESPKTPDPQHLHTFDS